MGGCCLVVVSSVIGGARRGQLVVFIGDRDRIIKESGDFRCGRWCGRWLFGGDSVVILILVF